MADRNGEDLRRVLVSAEFLSDRAIFLGPFQVNTLSSKSNALLCRLTLPDHFLDDDMYSYPYQKKWFL